MAEPILTLSGVSKSFPGVRALSNVSLSVEPGRVLALIGENGAGKSTIVKVLTGIYRPDEGEIRVRGEVKSFSSPRDAWSAGIAAIHQETVMFDELTVAENIFMGHMPVAASGMPRSAKKAAKQQAPSKPGATGAVGGKSGKNKGKRA